ncbi:hypothetical protein Clacol_005860 [Clathrus columnatus]|uniref:Uncharacterized protein n=1 Tax=Clathrus columnatus TaxID=1419009 RepID=A0AAV5AAI7_9AGAM|nr:hypothetical protein Clacol_005860 [Clathrus columnatus]
MTSLLSQVTNNPLLSGAKATALVQIQSCIDSAILIAGTVYQSLGLHKPTVLDVKHEFSTLIATIEQVISTVNALPHDVCSEGQILDLGPKGAAYGGAISRTTASIKSISGPVSHEDGVALLSSYKEVQANVIVLITAVNIRMGALERGASGLCDYAYNKVISLYESPHQEIVIEELTSFSPP